MHFEGIFELKNCNSSRLFVENISMNDIIKATDAIQLPSELLVKAIVPKTS